MIINSILLTIILFSFFNGLNGTRTRAWPYHTNATQQCTRKSFRNPPFNELAQELQEGYKATLKQCLLENNCNTSIPLRTRVINIIDLLADIDHYLDIIGQGDGETCNLGEHKQTKQIKTNLTDLLETPEAAHIIADLEKNN